MSPQEWLRDAAGAIEAALAQLDTHNTDCPTCGRKQFRNLVHARVQEQLVDLPDKLRRAADKVEQSPISESATNNRAAAFDLGLVLRKAHVTVPDDFWDRHTSPPVSLTLTQLEYLIGAALQAAAQPQMPPR